MARYFIRFAETAGGTQVPAALFRREMRDSVPSDATIGPGGWQLTDELPGLLRAADSGGLREVTRERALEFEQEIIAASSQLAGPELRRLAALAGCAFIHPPAGALFALSDMETHFRVAPDGREYLASRASRGGPFTEIIRSASLPVITWYLILLLRRDAGPRAEPLPLHPASPVSQDAQVRSARGWAVQAGWSVVYFPGGAAGEAAARHYARAADASCRRTHVLWAAGRLQVKVRITDEGHLEFSGQDLTVRGEVSEYEYVLTVKPTDLPTVTAALGGPPGADVIELLVASAEMIIRTGELSWLRSLGTAVTA